MSINFIENKDSFQKYLSDESNAFHADPILVKRVYLPENTQEIKEIILQANKTAVPCTVSGAGTGITGSRVPLKGGYIISIERLLKAGINNSLIEENERNYWKEISAKTTLGNISIAVNVDKKEAVVPAGISIEELEKILPEGLLYPPDPTEKSALIGGTIATNASGARSFRYKATRKWIQGLEIVLPDGNVFTINRNTVFADEKRKFCFCSDSGSIYEFILPSYNSPEIKNAAGLYINLKMDLIDLFIGCEGIFGIITKARIKLVEKSKQIFCVITFFDNVENADEYVKVLRDEKSYTINAIEYFDENSLVFMQEKFPNVKSGMKAAVFVEMPDADDSAMEWLLKKTQEHESKDDWFADNQREIKMLKDFRHALPEGVNSYLKQHQQSKLGTDFVVPQNNFNEMMAFYREAGQSFKNKFPRTGHHFVLFGHIGDCHLHFNFFVSTEEEKVFAKELYLRLAKRAISLGGTISGEHGVGKKTINLNGKEISYLELMLGESSLKEIAGIKKILDPNMILNIGNIIGMEYLQVGKIEK